eukprot:1312780-Amphidinium_carterae.1
MEDERMTQLSRKERKSIEASGYVVEVSDVPCPITAGEVYMIGAAAQEEEHEQGQSNSEGLYLPEQVDPLMMNEPEDED